MEPADEISDVIDSDTDDTSEESGNERKRRHSLVEISDSSSNSSDKENENWIYDSSESETESENENWDDRTTVIPKQQRDSSIIGFHVISNGTSANESNGIPLKQCKLTHNILMNSYLTKQEFFNKLRLNWKANKNFAEKYFEFITNPFKLCVIDQFLENKNIVDEIREEMYEIDLNKRSMDLYEFFQSNDLKDTTHNYLRQLYEFLKSDVMSWVEELTGFELNKISATCSIYTDTDYLLVHDDLQEDRAIAFILYLTDPPLLSSSSLEESWKLEMGGALELLNKDKNGHPLASVKQIFPQNNRFVFFNVTNDSYHQVAEILSMDHCRMSINGWFHTPTPNLYKAPLLEPANTGIFSNERFSPLDTNITVDDWVSQQYLRRETRKQIQSHIELESEISLHEFFRPEKFIQLSDILKSHDVTWEWVGPPNRKKYEVLSNGNIPIVIKDMLKLFQSKSMFCLLKDYTDLDLDPDISEEANPTLRFEFQRWSPGCYSVWKIFSEYDWNAENELDLIMYFADSSYIKLVGGETMYLSTDEKVEDALITLQAQPNTLNIVCRDTARIVKHISKRSFNNYFYTIVCSYKE